MEPGRATAYTRTDLLVVGLSALLLIPPILWSRESGRRSRCAGNLRQIGVALLSYAETHQIFPYAARWTLEDLPSDRPELQPRTGHATHENWLQLLLPYMGEQALAGSFDRAAPITDPRNAKARTAGLTILRCPDDPYNRQDNLYVYTDAKRDIMASFARGNYAINGGSQSANRYPGGVSSPSTDGYRFESQTKMKDYQVYGNGVAGINKAFRRDDFRNGLSTLVAINEVRAGIHPIDGFDLDPDQPIDPAGRTTAARPRSCGPPSWGRHWGRARSRRRSPQTPRGRAAAIRP